MVVYESGGTSADTPISFAQQQQGEQLGWVLSLSILWALSRHLTSLILLMLGTCVPMMFRAVLITCCRALLSWALHKPCQFVIFPVRMLSIAPL